MLLKNKVLKVIGIALLFIIAVMTRPTLANIAIKGKITHSNGVPASGLRVEAYDHNVPPDQDEDFVGGAITDSGGNYIIECNNRDWDQDLFNNINRRPDIYLRMYERKNNQWIEVKASEIHNNWRLRDNSTIDQLVTTEVGPPAEDCSVPNPSQDPEYAGIPPGLTDCGDPHCGRLIKSLRQASQTRDAREILTRSAVEYHFDKTGEFPADSKIAQALADLSVTGREAYRSFQRIHYQHADVLAYLEDFVKARIQLILPGGHPGRDPSSTDIRWCIGKALERAHKVAWVLRGPTRYRRDQRPGLDWIAVSGEDDPPHHPVNVPSAPYPQYNMTVQVPVRFRLPALPEQVIQVNTRYTVATEFIQNTNSIDLNTIPPDGIPPVIIGDIILFIHGHSSRLEEAMPLIPFLHKRGAATGRPITIIAMDLPSNGYSSMIDHETVAPWLLSNWNSSYPILDFIEEFVIAFVNGLEAQQPEIHNQIIGVIGGSLGGNMTLRLSRRELNAHPWLCNIVSWSPASSWHSWARATLNPFVASFDPGRYFDVLKHEAVCGSRDLMREDEEPNSRHRFFYADILGIKVGFMGQSDHWYRSNWPCRHFAVEGALRAIEEIYNPRFRRWHWRVAHEQLIFSYWDSDNPDPTCDPDPAINPAAGPPRYSQIQSRLLLAAGASDNLNPEKIYENTKSLAKNMTMVNGEAVFLGNTGHSIHAERPDYFSRRIIEFLYQSPPPPLPSYLIMSAIQ